MRNTPLLRGIFLFIAVSAAVYNVFFLIKVSTHPETVAKMELTYGYWVLPVAIVSFFLYSYLNKKPR